MAAAVCTREVEREGDEAMVFAEDAQRLLPLDQAEEVVRDRLSVEEVVDAQQEVPGGDRGGVKQTNRLVSRSVHCAQRETEVIKTEKKEAGKVAILRLLTNP